MYGALPTHQHLDCFQIHLARLAHASEEVRSSCSTSCMTACWTSAVYFLLTLGALPLAEAADLLIQLEERAAQILKLAELGDFPFCLADRHWRRQRFADRLALDLVGKTPELAVAGVVGLSAMAGGFASTAGDSRDRTGSKIAQLGKPDSRGGTLLFQFREGLVARDSFLRVNKV